MDEVQHPIRHVNATFSNDFAESQNGRFVDFQKDFVTFIAALCSR